MTQKEELDWSNAFWIWNMEGTCKGLLSSIYWKQNWKEGHHGVHLP